jgi:hypothetical protein
MKSPRPPLQKGEIFGVLQKGEIFGPLRETFWLRPSALVTLAHLTLEFSRVMPNIREASAVEKIGEKRRHSAKKATQPPTLTELCQDPTAFVLNR